MKKYLFLLSFLSLFVACTTTNNNFSIEANEFLDALDNRSFNGKNGFESLRFEFNGILLATYGSPAVAPFNEKIALCFINTKDDGASTTHGIYQQTRSPEQFIGIVRSNNNTLYQTGLAADTNSIAWGTETEFAQR